MYVDAGATEQAPRGFTIWRTPTKWQAMADDESAWGPMRRQADQAIVDAETLKSVQLERWIATWPKWERDLAESLLKGATE